METTRFSHKLKINFHNLLIQKVIIQQIYKIGLIVSCYTLYSSTLLLIRIIIAHILGIKKKRRSVTPFELCIIQLFFNFSISISLNYHIFWHIVFLLIRQLLQFRDYSFNTANFFSIPQETIMCRIFLIISCKQLLNSL